MHEPQVQGEHMAIVIPFPLDRVRQAEPERENSEESTVMDLPPTRGAKKQASRARNLSLHALSQRAVSRKELEDRLESRGLEEDLISQEIGALSGSGLIDDRALAHDLVDRYFQRGALGRRAVGLKLRARGLPEEIIREALDTIDEESEENVLRALAQRKVESLVGESREARSRKLGSYLLRKGFEPSRVYDLVRELTG